MEHLLLIFSAQDISDEAHIAFGRRFSDLEIHPSLAHRPSSNKEIYRVSNVDEDDQLILPKEMSWQCQSQSWRWHTNSSFRKFSSKAFILHRIETTNASGNTSFANMYSAYDALDDPITEQIEHLNVIHDHDYIAAFA